MLKAIALAGIFIFTSAVSTAAISSTSRTSTGTRSAPTPSQPKGFCVPAGTNC